MKKKEEGPFRRFARVVEKIRKQPLAPNEVEKFNRIVEKGCSRYSTNTEQMSTKQAWPTTHRR